jgi:hypothetical protein
MALPADWKLRRFKLRWFFKEALRGFLPDEIISKSKKGLRTALRRLGDAQPGAHVNSPRIR